MKASVPAQCPQVPGLQVPVLPLADSVLLRALLQQLPDSVPRAPLRLLPADSVLPAPALPLAVSSVVPVVWA